MQHRLAVRHEVVPSPDGRLTHVWAVGYVIAFQPGLPASQPVFAALFMLGLLSFPEVRQFALFSIPAGLGVGALLYSLRRWRQRVNPVPEINPLGL